MTVGTKSPVPCPFCGKEKIKVDSKRSNNMHWEGAIKLEYHVATARCNSCHARGPSVGVWVARSNHINVAKALEEKAIEAWNRRATEND